MSDLPIFGAGIWHFATYVDRYATEGYGEPVGLLEQIDKAGAVGDLSVVDLNWPFAGFDGTLEDVKAALSRNRLRAVAITPEIYNKDYIKGSITNPEPAVRAKALALLNEATELAKGYTNGQGADVSIVTIGITKPEHVGNAFASIRKQGTVVVTGLGDITEVGVPIPIGELTLFEKKIKGSLFGSSNPKADIPKMLDLYNHGKIKLDELVTKQYKLDEVAQGYEDMHAGKNIRGVLIFD